MKGTQVRVGLRLGQGRSGAGDGIRYHKWLHVNWLLHVTLDLFDTTKSHQGKPSLRPVDFIQIRSWLAVIYYFLI